MSAQCASLKQAMDAARDVWLKASDALLDNPCLGDPCAETRVAEETAWSALRAAHAAYRTTMDQAPPCDVEES